MASSASENNCEPKPKIQIYSTPTDVISTFWKDKYERDAKKYWDIFYKRHENRFFKDRHYLDKEWGRYFSVHGGDQPDSSDASTTATISRKVVVLEVGCGAGNTIFPLISTFPNVFMYACDFSPRAINLIKAHKDYEEDRVHAFVCDATVDDLTAEIPTASVDIVTLIFVLSAVSPEKMSQVLQNIRHVLKPNGHVLLRDYAIGDLAQERFTSKEQKISDNFYVRGDGTRAFYFSEEVLTSLFIRNGFTSEKIEVHHKRVENRSRGLVMDRRWIQGEFCFNDGINPLHLDVQKNNEEYRRYRVPFFNDYEQTGLCKPSEESNDGVEVDLSESIGMMLGDVPAANEVIDILIGDQAFSFKCLSKEYQHTCKTTGFVLWESALMLAPLLAANLDIVAGKTVLELGCGSAGICSMAAAKVSDLVVATDGDPAVLDLLNENIKSNARYLTSRKLVCERLEWGNSEHINAIRSLNTRGFDVIIGTDVMYVADAIIPFFETAKALISTMEIGKQKAALILCHIIRQVDEGYILSAASQCGFHLEDKWPSDTDGNEHKSLIGSWFSNDISKLPVSQSALRILYFQA